MSIYSLSNEQRGMCRNGHPWEGENIMTLKGGGKRCRKCYVNAQARYKTDEKEFGQRLTLLDHENREKGGPKAGRQPQFISKLLKRLKRTTRFPI
jgi:hypothetical protein